MGAFWSKTKVDQTPEVNTTISPRVEETKPKMVTAIAVGTGPSFWGAEMHFLIEVPS